MSDRGQMKAPVTIDDLKHLFDLAVDTPLVCSGSFDTDDVDVLRRIATLLGVDPNSITPDEFIAQYPHAFVQRTGGAAAALSVPVYGVRMRPGWDGRAETRDRYRRVDRYRYETADEVRARLDAAAADPACQAGAGYRTCGKPREDKIHV